jgi:AGZA family xanthine/uracil permease-like MFS transporter
MPFSPALVDAFARSDTWIHGAFALEQGFIFAAMVLSAATVAVIERRFLAAAVWCWVGAALCAAGLLHSYKWTSGDTAVSLTPAWPWAVGYLMMGIVFAAARFITVPGDDHGA